MSIKKGDLVFRNSRKSSWVSMSLEGTTFEFESAIVLCDPYVAVFTNKDLTGKAYFSSEKVVVDLLVNKTHIKKVPVDLIDKYER